MNSTKERESEVDTIVSVPREKSSEREKVSCVHSAVRCMRFTSQQRKEEKICAVLFERVGRQKRTYKKKDVTKCDGRKPKHQNVILTNY